MMHRALAAAEPITVLRWSSWQAGVAQGTPAIHDARLLFAPVSDASDTGGRRGLVIPRFDVFGQRDVDLEPHDLVERADGSVFDVDTAPQRWTSPFSSSAVGLHGSLVQLVADGPETVTVRVSGEVAEDVYGQPVQSAEAGSAVTVFGVSVEPEESPEDASAGQSAPARYRLTGTGLTMLDAWSRVEWAGRTFEVLGTPLVWPWPPAHAYTTAHLRERL